MPDGAVRLFACREVSSAKLRPDDQVGAKLPQAIFITRREIGRCNRRFVFAKASKIFASVSRLSQALQRL